MRCKFCKQKRIPKHNLYFCSNECNGSSNRDINTQDRNGSTVLMYAVSDPNNDEMVKRLLKIPNIDVNIQNKEGWTALMYALRYGSIYMTQLLLSHPKIDPNLQDINGDTVLMMATQQYGYNVHTKLYLMHPRTKKNK